MLRPKMGAGDGIDELSGNAHPIACLADRTFENISDAEFTPNLLHVDRSAFVGEARIPSDDKEPFDPAERGDDLLNHSIGKIVLLCVTAHVLKGKHGN